MTSNINGIDVSECCCFEHNRCLWSKRYYENNNVAPLCEAVKNCYFKQFKRLEQREKALTELADDLQKRNHDLTLTNERLQEELDIKEKMLDKFMIGSGEILEKLQQENEDLRQVRKNSPDIQEPYIYLYRQIKKQCHKLEEENEDLKKRQISKIGFFCDCEQNAKYRQTLEEIRKEIWEQNRSCDNCPDERYGDCIGFNECAKNIIDNFLLKIDEVLDDRN